MRFLAATAALALAACATGEDAPSDDTADTAADLGTCDARDTVSHWVVDSVRFTRQSDGVSDGFDLDGAVTENGDATGCGIGDRVGLDGEPGIDNAFAGLIPILENTEFVAVEGLIQDTIESGGLLLIGEAGGLEGMNDDCTELRILRGLGTPDLGTDGAFLAGQTFDLDPDVAPIDMGEAPVVDGVMQGGPVPITLALTILDADLDLTLQDAFIRFRMDDDGDVSGVFSGGLILEDLLDVAGANGIDPALLTILEPAARLALDLAPNDQGECTQLSVSISFDATPVYVFEDALTE